jgi:cytochrome c peroxidase
MKKMRIPTKMLIIGMIPLLLCSCVKEKNITPDWSIAQQYYLDHINQSISYLNELKNLDANQLTIQGKVLFSKARTSFKIAEPYASYLNPEVGHRTNGPALPIFRDDSERVLPPIGLQKIEESIFEGESDTAQLEYELQMTLGMMNNLKEGIAQREVTPERFFIATHQQLLRIISMGVSGFDTPVSGWGIQETATSLKSLLEVYEMTIEGLIKQKNDSLNQAFHQSIDEAVAYIVANTDFETFDRYTLISQYISTITKNWVAIRKTSGLWEGSEYSPFNFAAPTFFETNSFNVSFFTPSVNKNPSDKQIALGEKLFFEKRLSANGKLACVSCHLPEKAYTDGLKSSEDKDGNPLDRNSPTLFNSVFQRKFFWDGRAENLLDQITGVFNNEKEFNTNAHQFSTEVLKDTSYQALFKEAYGQIPRTNAEIIKALSSYVSTLNGFDSKFDKNMRGAEASFTPEEIKGMNLFMGKALCATCHFIPLTNGTVPPFFNETESEVIGVPKTSENKEIDDDLGFFWRYGKEIHRGMFKTPTLRNIELTAPYMHNGVYATLEEVMDFYNKGGGAGLGFNIPHQTLPFDSLQLDQEEIGAIIAFMKTLTDTPEETY